MRIKKILLVDDDEISSKILMSQLEKKGLSLDLVGTMEGALEKIGDIRYDVILLDIILPGGSGLDLLTTIREKNDEVDLPVILITGKTGVQDIVEGLELGASDYLTKPVNAKVAYARIKTQLKLKELQLSNLAKRETETINAMITTYNHEINNPLSVAIGYMRKGLDGLTEEKVEKITVALKRIKEIVSKIEDLSYENNKNDSYVGEVKKYKLK